MAIIPIDGPVKVDNSVDGLPSILGHPITYDVKELCTHPNINMWSKYKPVSHPKPFDPTDNELEQVNYGILIPSYTSIANLMSFMDNDGTWKYTRPVAGDPLRLGDFRGYTTEAGRFYNVHIPAQTIGGGAITIQMNHIDQAGGLTWSDFGALDMDNIYFGANANGINYTESEPITADNVGYLEIPATGNATIYAYLALKSPIDPSIIQRFYALEGGYGYAQYLTTGIRVDVLFTTFYPDINTVNVSIKLTNMAVGGSTPLTGVSVQIRYGDNDPLDQLESGEATHNFGDMTVAYGTPITLDHMFRNVLYNYSTRGGYVYFQVASHPTMNQNIGLGLGQF